MTTPPPPQTTGPADRVTAKTKPRGWRRYRVLIEIALIAVVFFGIRAFTHRGVARGPAPAIEANAIDGRVVSLQARRGRPVLVHFWATWCEVCRLEQGSIDAIARDHDVITVASQSGGGRELAAFLGREGLHFPVVADSDGALARAWGVDAFPADFVVDASGSIRFAEVGYSTGLGLRARLALAK